MGLISGFIMSLGMFSIIPVPRNSWNEKYMPLVIPCLPLVGAVIGLIWYGASLLLSCLSVPLPIQYAMALFVPFILSGFIHADGYMDTADAVFSRRDLEEKKRILKDPHVGAFAVIAIAGLVLFQFCAVWAVLESGKARAVLILIPVISRCVAGAAMLNLKPVFETGYNASFRADTKTWHTVFICLTAAASLAAGYFMLGFMAMPLAAGAITGILAVFYLYKQFDGISGDISGCVITVSELAALLCMAMI